MYGGTAKTYCRWKQLGEPFKENNALYIMVEHPTTKAPKKVRWYKDKAHNDMMPNAQQDVDFLGKLFFFRDKDDTILAIRESDLTKDEVEQYFENKWRYGVFFDGIWYADKNTERPPVGRSNKYFNPTWEAFVRTAVNQIPTASLWQEELKKL